MGKSRNTYTVKGTKGNPQISLSQGNAESKARELAKNGTKKNDIAREKDSEKSKQIKFDGSLFNYEDSKEKIVTYVLNIDHFVGGPKAKFFIKILGFSPTKPEQFYNSIKEAINEKIPIKISNTEFGLKYKFHEKVNGVNGISITANVIIIIQRDNEKITFRLISAYPGKKEEK